MSGKVYPVPADWAARAFVDDARYREMYARSVADPDGFWGEQGRADRLDQALHPVKNTSFTPPDVSIKWFEDGTLNVSANCIDRHLATRGDQAAIIWEGDDPERAAGRSPTASCTREVCRFANVLKRDGRQEGRPGHHLHADDPRGRRTPCSPARGSAPSTRSSSAASRPTSLAGRIDDCRSKLVITADEGLRGGKKIPLKDNADAGARQVARRRAGHRRPPHRRRRSPCMPGRDFWYHELAEARRADCPAERDGRRGPALHPLHLGLDRQAEGRAAHHRRLSRLRRADPPATSSTTTTATSTGAPPTSAGSPATPTSSTARSPTAPRR